MKKKKEKTGFGKGNEVIYGSQEYDYDDVSLGIYGMDENGKSNIKDNKFLSDLDKDLDEIMANAPSMEEVKSRNKLNNIK